MVEIFDSLVHPTINGTWLNPRYSSYSNIEILISDMKKYGIKKALAVGMKGVGNYSLETYIKFLKPYPQLIPIAYCEDPTEIPKIRELGYLGIKIHPRLSNLAYDDDIIFDIISQGNKENLMVLYCGFLGISNKFLRLIGENKLIFLHCGGKNLIETFNALQEKKNILIDLSYTMSKYSELTTHIKFIFQNFYHKICIGSDHPEIKLKELRERFDYLTQNLSLDKIERIAYKNLDAFI